jgi:hypothetical protein
MFHKKMKNSKNQRNAIMGAKTWQLAQEWRKYI